MNFKFYFFLVVWAIFSACNSNSQNQSSGKENSKTKDFTMKFEASKELPLDKIQLPKGFKISVFAEVKEARSMAISPEGTIYVGNRGNDKVYAIRDEDKDGKADKIYTLATGLNMPNGVAFRDGSLYIAEVNRILRLDNLEANLANPPKPVVVYDKFPKDKHHGWKFIAFGPDGKLYVPVGAPCNVCERAEEVYSTITRMNPDGSDLEIFAKGVRNTVGFAWHPDTQELWFTDNGRDHLGNDQPNCELNRAPQSGLHFGFPYCHEGTIADPEFGSKRDCKDFEKPMQKLGPHTAPLGMRFYQGAMFPAEYQKQIFIAKHGSWNRDKKIGYDLSLVKVKGNQVEEHQIFAKGWLDDTNQKVWGRPVDVLELSDGSLLVSDDLANVIYRVTYEK
jgi:glucose/arabinose dehydrogenase